MVLVPEGRQILQNMTVLENLQMGAYQRRDKAEMAKDMKHIFERFPRLKERQNQYSGTLSGGEQQMLAIGRAMMARPEMLLLDEPSMGLAPLFIQEIFDVIEEINKAGTTVFLVEQNARKALRIADYAYVMEIGKIVMQGPAAEIANNPNVMQPISVDANKKKYINRKNFHVLLHGSFLSTREERAAAVI